MPVINRGDAMVETQERLFPQRCSAPAMELQCTFPGREKSDPVRQRDLTYEGEGIAAWCRNARFPQEPSAWQRAVRNGKGWRGIDVP